MATLSVIDGFEHGLATTAIYAAVGSITNVTSPVRTGNRALQLSGSVGVVTFARYTVSNAVVSTAFYITVAASLPGNGAELARLTRSSGVHATLRYNSTSGTFKLEWSDSSASVDLGPVLATNTTYRVVLEYDVSGNPNIFRGQIDDTTEQQLSSAVAATTVTEVNIGSVIVSTPRACTYDDWLISVTDGDYEEMRDWVSHQVERLSPTGDGTHNIDGANLFERTLTGVDITNDITTAYQLVDDAILDLTPVDHVNQIGNATTNYVEVTLNDLAVGSLLPAAVRMYGTDVESSNTGSTPSRSYAVLADGTAVTPDLKLSTDDPGLVIAVRKKMLDAPSGGWDRTKVDGLKVRMGHGDGAPDSYFASFVLEAAMYEAAVGGSQFISIIVGV